MYHTENNTTCTVGLSTCTCIEHTYHNGVHLYTFELLYPRYIHGEFLTHRSLSRNSCSSRATPVEKMIKEVSENPVIPNHVFMNKRGMVGTEPATGCALNSFYEEWIEAKDFAVERAEAMLKSGVHKQHINRILEPYQFIRTIVTATEWDNFFKLRLAPDAQPEIQDLARAIKNCMDISEITSRFYHLPYVTEDDIACIDGAYFKEGVLKAMLVSSARCARVSYMKHDGTAPNLENDFKLSCMLLNAKHMSPFEHQAIPTKKPTTRKFNLVGFRSYRYMIETNTEYKLENRLLIKRS